jgi:S-formylglutathione hydrolase FrmB
VKAETAPAEQAADAPKEPPDKKTVETMPEGCTRELLTVASPSMKRRIRVAVVLPPDYAKKPDARYPVLYALHGMGAPYTTFTDMSPLRKYLVDHPMILVCFDGDRASCYVDSTEKPESQFTTFFFDELLPYVAENYRTSGRRAVTGFSMGGYGALHYLLVRPELFTSVSSLSGAFTLFMPHADGRPPRHSELLGDYEKNRAAYDKCQVPGRLVKCVADGTHLPPLMLTCGTEDGLVRQNREFVKLLVEQNAVIRRKRVEPKLKGITDRLERRRKSEQLKAEMMIDFTYVETPGGHDWPYWRGASDRIARFHWRHFQRAAKP